MSEFVNTKETMGEDETLDALVAHTLTEFKDNEISEIGSYSFYYNDGLETLDMPNVTTIGTYAFQNCKGLKSVSLDSLPTVANYAFSLCTALEECDISSATTINQYAFQDCTNLSDLTAGTLTTIGNYAFQNCISLSDIDLSSVINIGNYAFDNTGVGSIVAPNATTVGTYTGKGGRVSTIDLTKLTSIAANKFNGANALVELILRNSSVATLSATSALTGTAIAAGYGYVYVPDDLVDSYKSATNWSTYASQIKSINDYPLAIQNETITDSWSDILAAETAGTYSTKYSVGDIKYLDVGGTKVPMQIVAFDTDELASGGSAKITWLSLPLICQRNMNFTNVTTNGWAGCAMRSWLRGIIYPQIESTVRSAIQTVTKTYKDVTTSSTLSISDTIWIPSAREMFGGSSYESAGCTYTSFFTDNASRIKKLGLAGSANGWWLRSASNGSGFYVVGDGGSVGNLYASLSIGAVFGFCT